MLCLHLFRSDSIVIQHNYSWLKKKKHQEGGWKKSLVGVAHSIICVSNRLLTAALGSTKPWDSILFTAIGLPESMTT